MKPIFLKLPRLGYYYLYSKRNEWQSPQEIQKLQWKKFKFMLSHAYDNCEIYHKKMKSSGLRPEDIKSKQDLLKIPTIDKEEYRKNFPSGVLAKGYNLKNCYLARTSGSTGEPLQIAIDPDAILQKMIINLRTCEMANYRIGEKLLQVSAQIDIGYNQVFNLLLRRKYISPFEEDIKKTIDEINLFKPTAIVGYTSFIKLLAETIRDDKNYNFSLKSIMTTGELLLPNSREKIEDTFNTELFDQYGSVEFGRISGECSEHQGYHINVDTALVEFVKDNEHCTVGETGDIIVTSLINKAAPFIRYRIDDLGKSLEESCNCGRSLPLMNGLSGRIQDFLCTADGIFVIPEKAYRMLRKYDSIKQFQVIQKMNKNLIIKVLEEKALSKRDIKSIIKQFQDYLGNIGVDVEIVKEISRSQGKHHYIKSLIQRREY